MRNDQGRSKPHVQVTTTILDETPEQVQAFKDKFGKIVDEVTHWYTSFDRMTKKKVDDDLKKRQSKFPVENHKIGPCTEIVTKLSVNSDGTVSGCCGDYDKKLVVGDFNKESLNQIWNGEIVNSYRNLIKSGNRCKIGFCSTCANQYMDPEAKKEASQT